MHTSFLQIMSKSGKEKPYKPQTALVHLGRTPQEHFGAVNTPVFRASTIVHPSMDALLHKKPRFTYGRRGTPATASLEAAMTTLHEGAETVLTPSGLSACVLALLTAGEDAGEVLIPDSAYEPTRNFALTTLRRWGIGTRIYDPLCGQGIADLIGPNTRAILVESPGSLTFEVQDLPAIATVAQANKICLIADNTWAGPLLCHPLHLGADLVVESGTKYIVGHSDANIGLVTANARWAERLRSTHYHMGLTAGADDVFLALRGLRTLAVRLTEAERSVRTMIAWAKNHPLVDRVLYPGDPDDPGYGLWSRDFRGANGLFGLALKPMSQDALAACLDGLELFGMGYSWGGFESLIIPAQPHRTVRPFPGPGPLLRLSIGLEAPEDLIADLDAGLARAANHP